MVRKQNAKTKSRSYSSANGAAVVENGATGERATKKTASQQGSLEMQRLTQEIMRLVEASRQGRLEERGRPDQFEGTHREIVQGINEMLDAILLPIGEGNRILAQISSGRIDELITQTYRGDHENMKAAVNNVGIVLQGLQKEL